jgi:O-antigen/teichoic acid export membrane protein
VRVTVLAIAAFAAVVALALLAIGPFVMEHLFGQDYSYGRVGLALVGVGMGLHLTSGALNQAALARDRVRAAAICWLLAAAAFLGWMLSPAVANQLSRTEIGYAGATGLLALMLWTVYRQGSRETPREATQSAPTARAIAR